jgi:hypothetical protein
MSSIKLELNDFNDHSVIPIPAVGFRVIGIGLDGKLKKKDSNGIVTDFSDSIPQVSSNWNSTTGISVILNKPTNVSAFANDSGYLVASQIISKLDRNINIIGTTSTKITFDNNGLVTSSGSLIASDIPLIEQTQVSGLVFTLGSKAPLFGPIFTGNVTVPNGVNTTDAVNKGQLDKIQVNIDTVNASIVWAKSGSNISNINTQNVGIGTTTPNAKLEVNSGTINKSGIRMTNLKNTTDINILQVGTVAPNTDGIIIEASGIVYSSGETGVYKLENGNSTLVGGGYTSGRLLVRDSFGNFYIVSGSSIIKITLSGVVTTHAIISGVGYIGALIIDNNDNIYVFGFSSTIIKKVNSSGVVSDLVNIVSTKTTSMILGFDNYIYLVLRDVVSSVLKISLSGSYTTLATNFAQGSRVVQAPNGDLCVTYSDNGTAPERSFYRITMNGVVTNYPKPGLTQAFSAIAVDSDNNVYGIESGNTGKIYRVSPDGIYTYISSGASGMTGLGTNGSTLYFHTNGSYLNKIFTLNAVSDSKLTTVNSDGDIIKEDRLVIKSSGILTVPNSTIQAIKDDSTGKSVTTKEYIASILAIPVKSVIELTKAELDTATANSTLIPGTLYKISGVHPSLYNDGTTSGTTIYLKALSVNKLSESGHGEFWNPKYAQGTKGNGIFHNKISATLTSTSGTFLLNESVTNNLGGTGFIIGTFTSGATNLIIGEKATWDNTVTTITGVTSGATATFSLITSAAYGLDAKTIWGGYAWKNTSGLLGGIIDKSALDSNWVKLVYSTDDYNHVFDEITYEIEHDYISSRLEVKGSNHVIWNYFDSQNWGKKIGSSNSAISAFQFGNLTNDLAFGGMSRNYVNNSWFEAVNFLGSECTGNTFKESVIHDNYLGVNMYIGLCNFDFARVSYNKFMTDNEVTYDGTYLQGVHFGKSTTFSYNLMSRNSIFYLMMDSNSSIRNVRSRNSTIYTTSLNNSYMENTTMISTTINDLSLVKSSYFRNNVFTSMQIIKNSFDSTSVQNNIVSSGSISNNVFRNSDLGVSGTSINLLGNEFISTKFIPSAGFTGTITKSTFEHSKHLHKTRRCC